MQFPEFKFQPVGFGYSYPDQFIACRHELAVTEVVGRSRWIMSGRIINEENHELDQGFPSETISDFGTIAKSLTAYSQKHGIAEGALKDCLKSMVGA